ncbi:LytTR family DNA-binding domain-containing protein [Anaerolentibacter hominis]|uniref:LytTR family DNA-binding domain-containing protein n=1 Tax=Anaerolentibacter hominis TaxID=3079009 RepID=UPI0031B8ACD3
MRIEIKIEPECKELKILIVTDKMTGEVQEVMRRLSEDVPQMLTGFRGDTLAILEQEDVIRIYAAGGKIFAETEEGEYTLRLRLYELEERLDRNRFVRISNSEIVNLRKVQKFDLSFSGTICVTLSNGAVTYVSRRYMSKIKQVLGI